MASVDSTPVDDDSSTHTQTTFDSDTVSKLLSVLNETNELNKSVFHSFLKTQHDFKTEDTILQEKKEKVTHEDKEHSKTICKNREDNLNTMIVNSRNANNNQIAENCGGISSLLLQPTINSIKETVVSLEYDQSTSSLNTHYIMNLSKDLIISQIKALPNHEELRLNIELTLYVLKIVKKLIKNKNINVEIQDIIVEILSAVYVFNNFEKKLTHNQVKFLLDNKDLIKSKKRWSLF